MHNIPRFLCPKPGIFLETYLWTFLWQHFQPVLHSTGIKAAAKISFWFHFFFFCFFSYTVLFPREQKGANSPETGCSLFPVHIQFLCLHWFGILAEWPDLEIMISEVWFYLSTAFRRKQYRNTLQNPLNFSPGNLVSILDGKRSLHTKQKCEGSSPKHLIFWSVKIFLSFQQAAPFPSSR